MRDALCELSLPFASPPAVCPLSLPFLRWRRSLIISSESSRRRTGARSNTAWSGSLKFSWCVCLVVRPGGSRHLFWQNRVARSALCGALFVPPRRRGTCCRSLLWLDAEFCRRFPQEAHQHAEAVRAYGEAHAVRHSPAINPGAAARMSAATAAGAFMAAANASARNFGMGGAGLGAVPEDGVVLPSSATNRASLEKGGTPNKRRSEDAAVTAIRDMARAASAEQSALAAHLPPPPPAKPSGRGNNKKAK